MREAQERHEKSNKKMTSTHARCGSSGGTPYISFMCNVTDVKQTMAYLNFAFVTNLQFSVCPTVTKTTLI